MIVRDGPQKWANVHVTVKSNLSDLILVDNSVPLGTPKPKGIQYLKNAAADVDKLIQEARVAGKKVRALGSGWALSDLAVTDGWLINTKALNGCFEIPDRYFDAGYAADKRPFAILAQCGISIAELNVYLEVEAVNGIKRALKTSGIGAGQTVAGSVSGNTHGSALKFGATPDYVAGIHLVTGAGKSLWIERKSHPVMNDDFVTALGATAIRDDEVFNAAVVSFGSFGVITAMLVETEPIYHLEFPKVEELTHPTLAARLAQLAKADTDPAAPYHYEFVFDPYDQQRRVMATSAKKVAFEPGHATPTPVWTVRNEDGFALGTETARILLKSPLLSSTQKCAIQYRLYRERAILDGVRGTPGQVFTATVFYFEGYTESALGVSIDQAPQMLQVCCDVIKQLDQPCISQVRLVRPGQSLLGFTLHKPVTCVFEFGLLNDANFPKFDKTLTAALKAAGIAYTYHWSKNSGLDAEEVIHMYGADRVSRWRKARDQVFGGDATLKQIFENPVLVRAGLS